MVHQEIKGFRLFNPEDPEGTSKMRVLSEIDIQLLKDIPGAEDGLTLFSPDDSFMRTAHEGNKAVFPGGVPRKIIRAVHLFSYNPQEINFDFPSL